MKRLATAFAIGLLAIGGIALAEPIPSGSGIFFSVDIDLAATGRAPCA
jgi:hypothetical protein